MDLKYGEKTINFDISPENILGIFEYRDLPIIPFLTQLKNGLWTPYGKERLRTVLRKNRPGDLVILVSDISRNIAQYSEILEFLVGEIVEAGIDEKAVEFVIALGTHRRHTEEENRLLYGNLTQDFRFTFHDCRKDLASIGKTSTGLEIQVNKRVRDADFVIATGRIDFHYLAGFSGGRKSILPGIASYDTIRGNHAKLRRPGIAPGAISNNIVAQEMDEAGHLFGIDYLLNVVETAQRQIAGVFCGDPVLAFREGVKHLRAIRTVAIEEKADCIIASAGGEPHDQNFFNGHKLLNFVESAVKESGSLVLIARCRDGLGNERFYNYLSQYTPDELMARPEEEIAVGGHRAYVTARIIKTHPVYVYSDLDRKVLERMGFIPISNPGEIINRLKRDHGPRFKAYIQPHGLATMPVIKNRPEQK